MQRTIVEMFHRSECASSCMFCILFETWCGFAGKGHRRVQPFDRMVDMVDMVAGGVVGRVAKMVDCVVARRQQASKLHLRNIAQILGRKDRTLEVGEGRSICTVQIQWRVDKGTGLGGGKRDAMTKKAESVLEAGVGRLMIYGAGDDSGEIRL